MLPKIGIFLAVIFSINLIAADVFLYRLWQKQNLQVIKSENTQECSVNCPKITDTPTPVLVTTPTATPTIKKVIVKKTRSIQYIPIPGSGSTLENKWVDLVGTEFYFSTSDYPNLTEAYFEANMRLVNGNGFAYLRLFDITAGIEVWGSEISTNSQNFTSVSSGKLTIRKGNHLYRVQAKSLTADTTVFNSGKIKIILENTL
ncbi:MAG: hypothetical protein Q8P53_04050 [Candidatus Shapirobacteria bacterium]|nr:hypothetical protein [Candidatus Shapirobacteria bacterium]